MYVVVKKKNNNCIFFCKPTLIVEFTLEKFFWYFAFFHAFLLREKKHNVLTQNYVVAIISQKSCWLEAKTSLEFARKFTSKQQHPASSHVCPKFQIMPWACNLEPTLFGNFLHVAKKKTGNFWETCSPPRQYNKANTRWTLTLQKSREKV